MKKLNEPVLEGRGASDYERYLRTDELLALQKSPEQVVHRDEHLFQTVHQASELWLKLACLEIDAAVAHIERDALPLALRLLTRATDIMALLPDQLHMLEHMSLVDYTIVRTALGHGSGFDSPGFRGVHRVSPALREAFNALLARRSRTVVDVYERAGECEDLYQLAERMIAWDERTILWRFHHLKVVERIIGGSVVGTQGTPVEVLERRIGVPYFPELWEVRNEITRRSKLGADGHGIDADRR